MPIMRKASGLNRKRLTDAIVLLVLLSISYFPVFHNLGKFQIRMWDEATYANNSLDMLTGGNVLVVQHLGEPDSYNTKPPLVIWLQALSMKVMGVNELAIRLPSAVFGLLTVLLVYFFSVRIFGNWAIGFSSSAVLLASKGYISNHVVRTGDLDAALVFWLTLGLFVFVDLVIQKPRRAGFHFLLLALSLSFGFLTKGIAGFFFLPFMLVGSFLFGNHRYLFRQRHLYISAGVVVVLCSSYYFGRELAYPGYLSLVLESELLRLEREVMSWHIRPFDWYFQNLKEHRFTPFLYVLPITLTAPFVLKSRKLEAFIYLSIVAIGYFLLISYPPVKLPWYDAPLFPILSVLLALSFFEGGRLILRWLNDKWKRQFSEWALIIPAVIFLHKPYLDIIGSLSYPEEHIDVMELDGAYLKHLRRSRPQVKQLSVFMRERDIEHYDQVLFYVRAYEMTHDYRIRLTQEMSFESDEKVTVCKPEDRENLKSLYVVEETDQWNGCSLLRIKGPRSDP